MKKRLQEMIAQYYLWLCGLPVVGGLIHFVFHTTTHLMGVHVCP